MILSKNSSLPEKSYIICREGARCSAGIYGRRSTNDANGCGLVTLQRNVTSASLMIVISLMILLPPHQVSGSITCSTSQSSFWKICGPIQALGGIDGEPTVVQANDGTLRL